MSDESEKVVRSVENQKYCDTIEAAGPVSKESPAMGEIMPPLGLPPNIKTIVITYDTLNDNVQVAGPLNDEDLISHMLYRASDEIEKYWDKMKSLKNK